MECFRNKESHTFTSRPSLVISKTKTDLHFSNLLLANFFHTALKEQVIVASRPEFQASSQLLAERSTGGVGNELIWKSQMDYDEPSKKDYPAKAPTRNLARQIWIRGERQI